MPVGNRRGDRRWGWLLRRPPLSQPLKECCCHCCLHLFLRCNRRDHIRWQRIRVAKVLLLTSLGSTSFGSTSIDLSNRSESPPRFIVITNRSDAGTPCGPLAAKSFNTLALSIRCRADWLSSSMILPRISGARTTSCWAFSRLLEPSLIRRVDSASTFRINGRRLRVFPKRRCQACTFSVWLFVQ